MIRPDRGKCVVTQRFGANPANPADPNPNPNPLGYGPKGHDGVDLGTPMKTELVAARTGRVRNVNTHMIYGLRIEVDNGTNIDYIGHLSKAHVSVGQQVTEGQVIALSGATGKVTGPHTHWGVYTYGGQALNPEVEMSKVNKGGTMDEVKTLKSLIATYEQAFRDFGKRLGLDLGPAIDGGDFNSIIGAIQNQLDANASREKRIKELEAASGNCSREERQLLDLLKKVTTEVL